MYQKVPRIEDSLEPTRLRCQVRLENILRSTRELDCDTEGLRSIDRRCCLEPGVVLQQWTSDIFVS